MGAQRTGNVGAVARFLGERQRRAGCRMMKKILRFMLIVGLFVATWTSTAACPATVYQLDVTCSNGTKVQGKGEDILPKLSATCVAELGSVVMQLIEVRQTRQTDPSNEV